MKTIPASFTDCRATVDSYTRKNPTRSLLMAAGAGLAAGFLLHALKSPPMSKRVEQLVTDFQKRLHKFGDHAGNLTADGGNLVHEGINRLKGFFS